MKILLSLSGGMDSTTLLYDLIAEGHELHTVFFDYGSKHNKYEKEAVSMLKFKPGIKSHRVVQAEEVFKSMKSTLLQSGGDIPEGHYSSETMRSTVVPGRNVIFLSILTGIAISEELEVIALAIHSGDHAIYPDCRPDFVLAMRDVVEIVSESEVTLWAPYTHLNKIEIVKKSIALGVPSQIVRTCYKDQAEACGKCGSCVERLEAFAENGAVDLAIYEKE